MKTNEAKKLLEAHLDAALARLQSESEVPKAEGPGSDFLDVAQGVELQELARLTASRVAERAKRLQLALTRVAEGEYGVCAECGAAISPNMFIQSPPSPLVHYRKAVAPPVRSAAFRGAAAAQPTVPSVRIRDRAWISFCDRITVAGRTRSTIHNMSPSGGIQLAGPAFFWVRCRPVPIVPVCKQSLLMMCGTPYNALFPALIVTRLYCETVSAYRYLSLSARPGPS